MTVVSRTVQENQIVSVRGSVTPSLILLNVQTVMMGGWEQIVALFVCMVHRMKMRLYAIVLKHAIMASDVTLNVLEMANVMRTVREIAFAILCPDGVVLTVKYQVGVDRHLIHKFR
jgi:hypothetical protein